MPRAVRTAPPLRSPSVCRALKFDGTSVRFHSAGAIPAPETGQALVRCVRLGVASPDLAVVAGRTGFVGTLGHECAGVVEAVGPASQGRDDARWVGKRVVINPVVPCAKCDACRGGLWAHCPQRQVMGLHGRDGVFTDALVVPITCLVELPRKVDDESAACLPSLAGAIHAGRLVKVEGKPFVTILGDGPVGLMTAQVLARQNASVRLLGKHPQRFTLCEKWGVQHRAAAEVGRRQDQDVVIDCTGSPAGTELALQLVRPRGSVIVKSWPMPARGMQNAGARVNLATALANELTVMGAGVGNLHDAVAALEKGELDVRGLISRRFRLADWSAAFDFAREPSTIKVLLEP